MTKKQQSIIDGGIMARGRREFIKIANGSVSTIKEMILAHCYDCTCGYIDGVKDCELKDCSLYQAHPYNPQRGKRSYTEEEKKAMVGRLQNARNFRTAPEIREE